jgi:hypothetical protein
VFDTDTDRQANRLYVDLDGRLDAETIDEAATQTVADAEQLREGFDVITDLTGFRPPSPEAAEPIKRAQAELAEMGMDRVVRVADEETSSVVVNAFERRSRDVGYSGETADSVAAAERLLDDDSIAGYADDTSLSL